MSFEIQRPSENLSLFPDPLRFMCVLLEGFRNGSDSGTELEHNHQPTAGTECNYYYSLDPSLIDDSDYWEFIVTGGRKFIKFNCGDLCAGTENGGPSGCI